MSDAEYSAKIRRALPLLLAYQHHLRGTHVSLKAHAEFIEALRADFAIEPKAPSSIALLCVISLVPRQEVYFGDLQALAPGLVVYRPRGVGRTHEPALLVRTGTSHFIFLNGREHADWRIAGRRADDYPSGQRGCEMFYFVPEERGNDVVFGIAPDRWSMMGAWLDTSLPPDPIYRRED